MRKKGGILAILLTLAMLVIFMPAMAFADDGPDYNIWFDEHDVDVYNDASTAEGKLDLSALPGGWQNDVDIDLQMGYWDNAKDDWADKLTEGKDYSFSVKSGYASVTIINASLIKGVPGTDIHVEATLKQKSDGNACAWADMWFHVRETKYEVDFPEKDEYILRDWNTRIDKRTHLWIEDSAHPGGCDMELLVKKVECSSNLVRVEYDGDDNDGQWRIEGEKFGNAPVKVTYVDENNNTKTYNFTLHIVTDVVDQVRVVSADGFREVFPGESIKVKAYGRHCYMRQREDGGEDDYDYNETTGNLKYTWNLTDDSACATLTADKNDPSTAILKFKTLEEMGRNPENNYSSGVLVSVHVSDNEGKAARDSEEWFEVRTNYRAIEPAILDPGMDIGDSVKATFTAKEYSYGQSAVNLDVEEFKFNYDENFMEIRDSRGNIVHNNDTSKDSSFTFTRMGDWQSDVNIEARIKNDDWNVNQQYVFASKNYRFDFDQHDKDIFNEPGSAVTTLDMSEFGNGWKDKYRVDFKVGYWYSDNDDNDYWTKVYEEGKDYTITETAGGFKVELTEEILNSIENHDDVRVYAELFPKGKEQRITDTDMWFHINEIRSDYDLPRDEDMLPEYTTWIDNRFRVDIQDPEHPDGYDDDLEVTALEVKEQHPDKDGETVVELEKDDNGWNCRAVKYGYAILQMTYKDIDGSSKTHEFRIDVKDSIYRADLWYAKGIWKGLPGTSIEMAADARREFIVYDEEDPEHWWHDNTTEGLKYKWTIIEGGDYATLEVNSGDQSKATVKFNKLPAGQDRIGERVIVRVSIDDGNEKDVISREEDLYVEDDYYQIYPGMLDTSMDIGESVSFTPEVRHYSLNQTGYKVVKGVTFRAEDVDEEAIKVTKSKGTFTVKRLKDWGTGFKITAEFRDNDDDHWEENWYQVEDKNYDIWFDPDNVDVYGAYTIPIMKSEDLQGFSKYDIEIDFACHIRGYDDNDPRGWKSMDEKDGVFSYDADRGTVTVYGSKIDDKYDWGDFFAILKINGADERNARCVFNLMGECPNHVMKTETKKATKTATGYTRKYCETCGEEIYKVLPKINSMTVTASTKTVKYTKVKKSAQTVAPLTVKKAAGKVTYTGTGTTAKAKKALSINKKTGKITVKKGTKKGTYKMKVKVKDAGSKDTKSKTVTKTVKIVVK
jgi:hypothetical protein